MASVLSSRHGSWRLRHSILCMAALVLFTTLPAEAMFLTRISGSFIDARACPKRNCPTVNDHALHAGKQVVIYEAKNGWARVSKYTNSAAVRAQNPGAKLPDKVAVWVPFSSFPETVSQSFAGEAVEKEEKKKKPVSFVPAKVPTPTRKPGDDGEATTASAPAKAETSEASKSDAETKVAAINEDATKPADGDDTNTSDAKPTDDGDNPAAVEAAAEKNGNNTRDTTAEKPEEPVETASLAPKLPTKLTPELKDKRLKALPLKPTSDLDLKSIIAMRHNGLNLLNDKKCEGIKEGGKSVSSPGWVYLVCEGEYFYRQFQVE